MKKRRNLFVTTFITSAFIQSMTVFVSFIKNGNNCKHSERFTNIGFNIFLYNKSPLYFINLFEFIWSIGDGSNIHVPCEGLALIRCRLVPIKLPMDFLERYSSSSESPVSVHSQASARFVSVCVFSGLSHSPRRQKGNHHENHCGNREHHQPDTI